MTALHLVAEGGEALHEHVELAAAHVVHDQEEVLGGLEGEVQPHDEGVVDVLQDVFLGDGARDVARVHDERLGQHLRGGLRRGWG